MTETATSPLPPEDDEISLLDIAIALGEEKRVILGIPVLATLGAVIYSLTLTPIYTATTTLALAQAQAQQLVALLKSRTIQETLVEQFNLKQAYVVESPSAARKALEGITRITTDKTSGVITIEVDDKDPALAAKLANGYAQALHHRLDEMETARTRSRREFYADLIQRLKSHPEDKSEVGVLARARLLDIVRQKEGEYAALRQSAPQADPVLQRRIKELHLLNAQLDTLEQAIPSSDNVKSQNMDKIILNVLTRQHEQARLDQAREPTLLQLIDVATPPEKRSNPKRTLIVGLGGVAGLFFGVLAAFIRRAWRKAGENPQSAGRMAELGRVWKMGWMSKG